MPLSIRFNSNSYCLCFSFSSACLCLSFSSACLCFAFHPLQLSSLVLFPPSSFFLTLLHLHFSLSLLHLQLHFRLSFFSLFSPPSRLTLYYQFLQLKFPVTL